MDWCRILKGVHQGCILSSCLFKLYAEYIMWNARLDDAQAEIKIAGKNIHNLIHADDTTLIAESKKEIKSLLMRVKEEWKSWLKTQHSKNNDDHDIWSHHFMTNRWGKCGNSDRLYFLGLQNKCEDRECSHEIKRCLLLGRKSMINPYNILKNKHHFANKGPQSQSYGFFQ